MISSLFSRKTRNALRMNPKIILNIIYSFFLNLIYFTRNFYRFKIFADFGSTITKGPGAKLIIDKGSFSAVNTLGDMTKAKSSIHIIGIQSYI